MARIRSIKPEFWKDGKISRLTHSAALFFIGLWNFCDDEGKCRADFDTIANSLLVFKKREIIWHVSALLREGLISISSDDHLDDISTLSYTHRGIIQGSSPLHHWIIVVSWHHQRISKPIHPKISINDLKDITPRVPEFGEERYTQDRIGKDRIGKDRIGGDTFAKEESNAVVVPISSAHKKEESKTEPPPHMKLVELWNQLCGELPKVSKTNPNRLKILKARWAEEPNEIYWVDVISKIKNSKFCNGENDRGWVANFDFLLRPDTHIKAIEGQYDNRESKKNEGFKTIQERITESNRALFEAVERGEA